MANVNDMHKANLQAQTERALTELAELSQKVIEAYKVADRLCTTTRYYEAHRTYWDYSDDIRLHLSQAMLGIVALEKVMKT